MFLVIVPVKNEAERIEKTRKQLSKFFKEYLVETKTKHHFVFIDDGSTDKTLEILNKGLNETTTVFRNKFEKGKGSALKTAYILANTVFELQDEDYIVFIDGDGQINPSEIKTFIKIMNLYDADVVVGNKRHPYSKISYTLLRRIVSESYNLIIRVLFHVNLRDTQAGLKIFKKYALDQVIEKISVKKYAFDLEMLVAFQELQMNVRVVDAPIFVDRQMNAGSITLSNIIHTFLDTIKIYVNKLKGFYK